MVPGSTPSCANPGSPCNSCTWSISSSTLRATGIRNSASSSTAGSAAKASCCARSTAAARKCLSTTPANGRRSSTRTPAKSGRSSSSRPSWARRTTPMSRRRGPTGPRLDREPHAGACLLWRRPRGRRLRPAQERRRPTVPLRAGPAADVGGIPPALRHGGAPRPPLSGPRQGPRFILHPLQTSQRDSCADAGFRD
jgi:hypothetical protein